MATLKDHQQAMVDLLASGSGIPASASRLAHAMHDVLALLNEQPEAPVAHTERRSDATTPGLNDALLASDIEACRPKATPAERRVKELENTVKQLRTSNAMLRAERDGYLAKLSQGLRGVVSYQEQAGCRKPDTQVCDHDWCDTGVVIGNLRCSKCGVHKP